jgi:hypothetical protein
VRGILDQKKSAALMGEVSKVVYRLAASTK